MTGRKEENKHQILRNKLIGLSTRKCAMKNKFSCTEVFLQNRNLNLS